MYLLTKPAGDKIAEFIQDQARLDFTYAAVGATRLDDLPSGYDVDRTTIQLGAGQQTFERAKRALRDWQHYQFDWIDLHRPPAPPAAGQTVGVLARALGLWVLNACRIVYVVEEDAPLRRFAFAYGTLPDHAESGEERFQVEWRDDDSVWYDILAFSRPQQIPARLAYLYVRRKQKQFGRESTAWMKRQMA